MGYIYIHTNKANGKKYIGQTSLEPEQRWGSAGQGYRSNRHFYSAIQKYGWDNFTHEVFELSESELDYAERYLILWYDTMNPEKGYNHESGGHRGKHFSEETKQRLSEFNKGEKNPMYGRTGEKNPMYGRTGEKNPFYGQTHSEKSKAKMSEARKGKHLLEETREKLKATQQLKSQEYHEYKANGGTLKWNEWCKANTKR